jgi:predicted nucleic-acid-binding protein
LFYHQYIVLCEVVGLLKGATYGFRKAEIINVLATMLHSAAFEFENRSTVDQALQRYKQGKAIFLIILLGRSLGRQAVQRPGVSMAS